MTLAMQITTGTPTAAAEGGGWTAELQSLVPTFGGKIAVTLLAVVLVGVVLSQTNAIHDRAPAGVPAAVWHVGVTALTIAVAVAAATVVILVWGLSSQLVELYARYRLGTGTVVQLALSALFLVGAYAMTGLVRQLTDEVAKTQPNISDHEREVIYRFAQLAVYFAAAVLVLGVWNADLGGLIVGAGFLGIVVGMAARQTLGAFIAGFVLMFSRPFEIGDWIEIGEYEGIVTDITIVNTRVQTFDGEYVMVPNDVISSEMLVNRSRKGRLRLEVDVGVDYDADPMRAADAARRAVDEIDDVLTVPAPQVILKEFGDSAILLAVRVWIDRPSSRRRWRTRTAVVEAVKTAFDDEGIKMPFPQRELTAREGAEGVVLAGGPDADPVGDSNADQNGERDRSQTRAADGGDGA
jgi:small-conductance mechanosensitive channel